MKRLLFILLIFCSGYINALEFDKQKMDDFFNHIESKNEGMGSVSLSKDGIEIYQKSIGYASIDDNIKASAKTKYRIGSISKTFTATLIMQLVEDNKLTLDTKLAQFFPSVKNSTQITIENLLQHRSGIFNITADKKLSEWKLKKTNKAEMVGRIAHYEPEFKPGSKMQYSNSNYILLTYIAEEISGLSFNQLLSKNIAKVCDLNDTYYGGKINPKNNEVYSYQLLENWQAVDETDMSFPQGAGGIVSNPTDLNKFLYCLFNDKLVSNETVKKMTTLNDGYGFGMFKVPFDDKQAFGHNGQIDGFHSMADYFQKEKLSFSYISNGLVMPINDIAIGVLSIYFGEEYEFPEFKPGLKLSTTDLDKYLGTYSTPSFPLKIAIFKKGVTLFAQATGQSAFPLKAFKKDKFKFDAAGIKLEFDPEKETMVLKQGPGNYIMNKEQENK